MNLKTGNRIYPIWAKEKKYTEKKNEFHGHVQQKQEQNKP